MSYERDNIWIIGKPHQYNDDMALCLVSPTITILESYTLCYLNQETEVSVILSTIVSYSGGNGETLDEKSSNILSKAEVLAGVMTVLEICL